MVREMRVKVVQREMVESCGAEMECTCDIQLSSTASNSSFYEIRGVWKKEDEKKDEEDKEKEGAEDRVEIKICEAVEGPGTHA